MWCSNAVLVGVSGLLLIGACQTTRTAWAASKEPPGRVEPAAPAAAPEAARPPAPQEEAPAVATDVVFEDNAFPPPIPDTDNHRKSWWIQDCLRCHDTGVADAPRVVHDSVPAIAMTAKCRTCHVLIPGLKPRPIEPQHDERFLPNAFPPMIPASESHPVAWLQDDCLLCHEVGVKGAPIVRHEDMPAELLTAKCRSCHVQVRSPLVPGH